MDKKTLYLECYSGISGDMTVAALLDLGADQEVLMTGLKSLNVDGYKVVISRKAKNSIDACDFDVILDEDIEQLSGDAHEHEHVHELDDHSHDHPHSHMHNHEADHDHSFGHDHDHSEFHAHSHTREGEHDHEHSHEEEHTHSHIHYGKHEHRNLSEINGIIEQSAISRKAKDTAKRIFRIVAEAEAKAHGKPIDEVHFHEVGAVDSIVDIVATAICLDNLGIEEVIVSELYEGTGQITCQHGIIPVPVPAVVNIAEAHNLPLHITSIKGELVTPTGAAIVAAVKTGDTLPAEFRIKKIGLGAGKRNYATAGTLRAMLLEVKGTNVPVNTIEDKVWVLEANIDDCSGEVLSMAMELLFKNGARDVYYTPIYMKKNRPAYLLGVICSEDKIAELEDILFTHTTTIGIRKHEAIRTTLKREQKTIQTPYGEAIVKVCSYKDRVYNYPEYESVKKLCEASGKDYTTLYSLVQTLAYNQDRS